jgi:hypothetical protein
MIKTQDARRWLICGLLACSVSAGGCARFRDWAWRTGGAKAAPRKDDTASEQVKTFNSYHEEAFGIRKGLIDPNQMP